MFLTITPGACAFVFCAVFWLLAICTAEPDPEEEEKKPEQSTEEETE